MGMVMTLSALPVIDFDQLVKRTKPKGLFRKRILDEEIHNELSSFYENNKNWVTDTDKSWDMILACFSDNNDRYSGDSILSQSLLGDHNLGQSDSIHGVSAPLVPVIAQELERFDLNKVGEVIPTLDADDVYCVTGDNGDDEEYVKTYIEILRKFYRKSADANRSVIICLQ